MSNDTPNTELPEVGAFKYLSMSLANGTNYLIYEKEDATSIMKQLYMSDNPNLCPTRLIKWGEEIEVEEPIGETGLSHVHKFSRYNCHRDQVTVWAWNTYSEDDVEAAKKRLEEEAKEEEAENEGEEETE